MAHVNSEQGREGRGGRPSESRVIGTTRLNAAKYTPNVGATEGPLIVVCKSQGGPLATFV